MDPLVVVLRLAHIGAGVLWVGAAWMLYLFVTPTLRSLGPDTTRRFTATIMSKQRLGVTILVATLITVGAGLLLLAIDINRFGLDAWFRSGFGIGITIGAIAAIGSFTLGPTLIMPLAGRMEKIAADVDAAGAPPTDSQQAELDRLGIRLRTVLTWDSALLLVSVVFMAVSRYIG